MCRACSGFVKSERVLNVIAIAKQFGLRPSDVICAEDEYTAFCFDEACSYILGRLEAGEEPHFKKEYKSFADIYKGYG